MKKRCLSLVLALAMILCLIPAQVFAISDPIQIAAASATEVKPGDTVTVTVTLPDGLDTAYSIQADLSFDTAAFEVTALEFPTISGCSGYSVDEANTNGKAVFAGYAMENTMEFSNVVLMTMTLNVKAGATIGSKSFEWDQFDILHIENDGFTETPVLVKTDLLDPPAVTVVKDIAAAIAVTGVTAPAKNAARDTDVTCTVEGIETAELAWKAGDADFTGANYAGNTAYTAVVTLTATDGYTFPAGVTFTVDGDTDWTVSGTGNTRTLTKTFPATADKEITALDITTPPTNNSGYIDGEAPDTTGMVVTATYDDATTDTNFTGYTVEPATLTKGDTSYKIKVGAVEATVTLDDAVAGQTVQASDYTIGTVETTYTGSDQKATLEAAITTELTGTSTYTYYVGGAETAAITDAGTYTVKVTYAGDAHYEATAAPLEIGTINVLPKTITASDFTINPLTYNGSEQAISLTTALDYGTEYTLSGTTALTDVADADVTATAAGIGNYTGEVPLAWNLQKKTANFTDVTVNGKVFDGTTDVDPSSIDATIVGADGNLVGGTDYDLAGVYASANVADGIAVTVTPTLIGNAAKNYTLSPASLDTTADIVKAAAPNCTAPQTQTLLSSEVVTGAKDYTFNLDEIIEGIPADAGTVTYAVTTDGSYGTASITGSTLTYSVPAAQAANTNDVVLITVSTTNYADKGVNINFQFKSKTPVEVALANIETTYGEDYEVAGTYAGTTDNTSVWTYTYTGTGSTVYPASTTKPTDAGTYSIAVEYTDDILENEVPGHIGSTTATLTIAPKAIAEADFTIDTADKEYNGGAAIEPTVSSTTLTAGTDYTVAYASNTAVGTATITVTAQGNYTGTVEKSFSIVAKAIAEADFTIDTEAKEYTGSPIEPTVTPTGALVAGTDYDVTYTNNTDKGTATITVTGKGNYTGTVEKTFEIAGIVLQNHTTVINGLAASYPYNRTAQTPAITVTCDGNDLVEGTDYTVAYTDNTDVGTATVTVTGVGNYGGEVSDTFEITKATIAEGDFTFDLEDKTFTGEAIEPEVTATVLVKDTDFTVAYTSNTAVGTATITVTGTGNYEGTVEKTFAIVPKDLSTATLAGLEDTAYTGEAIEPEVTVTLDNATLVKDTDYTVTYSANNTLVTGDDVTVTVTGIGNYTGSVEGTFQITKATVTVSGITAENKKYDGGTGATLVTSSAVIDGAYAGDGISFTAEGTFADAEIGADKEVTVTLTFTGSNLDCYEFPESVTVTANIMGADVAATPEDATVAATDASIVNGVDDDADKEAILADVNTALATSGYSDDPNGDVAKAGADAAADTALLNDAAAEGRETLGLDEDAAVDLTVTPVVTIGVDSVEATDVDTVTAVTYDVSLTADVEVAETADPTNKTNVDAGEIPFDGEVEVELGVPSKMTLEDPAKAYVKDEATGKIYEATVTAGKARFSAPSGSGKYTLMATNPAEAKIGTTFYPTLADAVAAVQDNETIDLLKDCENAASVSRAVKFTVNPGAFTYTINVTGNFQDQDDDADIYDIVAKPSNPVIVPTTEDEEPEPTPTENPFTDVSEDSPYYDAIMWAVENGVTTGKTDTTFDPNGDCNRAEFVTFLWRAAGCPEPTIDITTVFTDVVKGSFYEKAVAWAYENGITLGKTATTFDPTAIVKRSEAVTFIWRFAGLVDPTIAETGFVDVPAGTFYTDAVYWAKETGVTNGTTATTFEPTDGCKRGQVVTFLYRHFTD